MSVENGNNDENVGLPEIKKWFREAAPDSLMGKEDFEYYQNLPDGIPLYRGVAVGRNPKGISWTDDLAVAKWFANRYGKGGYVQVIEKSRKSHVLAYFNSRNEHEVVYDPNREKFERISAD